MTGVRGLHFFAFQSGTFQQNFENVITTRAQSIFKRYDS